MGWKEWPHALAQQQRVWTAHVCSRLSALLWDLSQKQNPVMPEVWMWSRRRFFNSSWFWCQDFLWRCTTFQPALAAKHLGKQSRPLNTNIPQSTVRKKTISTTKVVFAFRMEKANAEVAKNQLCKYKVEFEPGKSMNESASRRLHHQQTSDKTLRI